MIKQIQKKWPLFYQPSVIQMATLAFLQWSCVTTDAEQNSHEPLQAPPSQESSPRYRSIGDGLSQEEVLNVLKPHVSEVQQCYQNLAFQDPKLKGLIKIRLFINSQGLVNQFEILEQSVYNRGLEQCIENGLKSAVFNKPRGSSPVTVVYTYKFQKYP